MSIQVRAYQPVIPANTPIATPFTFAISFPAMNVDRIRVKIPPGPRGNVGFALGSSGQAVIPYQAGQWIIADNDDLVFELDDYWDSGSWTFFGYNLGQFAHTIYLTFELSLVPQPTAPHPALPNASLSSSGTTSSSSVTPPTSSTTPTPSAVLTAPAAESTPTVPAPPPVPTPPPETVTVPPIVVPPPPV